MQKTIPILYEDEHVLVINKPAGLAVHGDGKTKEYVLTDWLLEHYPEIENVGEAARYDGKEIARPGIVHRLDRDTSGVLVIAKDQDSFEFLKKQFQDREIKKIYHALVHGVVKEEKGVIDRPIGRSASDFRRWSAQRGARGELREAITGYRVLSRGKKFSFIELSPKTGRTHQLRVHLKAINHPIVGDSLYAGRLGGGLGMTRLALHASHIEFSLPDGKRASVEAPMPNDMSEAIAKLASA